MTSPMLLCAICGGEAFHKLTDDVYQCDKCELAIQIVLPANPIGLYDRIAYDAQRHKNKWLTTWERYNHDYAVASKRLIQLQHVLKEWPMDKLPRWTDFGCANGAMLAAARRAGYQVRGIELDQNACDEISAILGIQTISTSDFLASPQAHPTEILSLNDVLEHFVDPVGLLTSMVKCLPVDGLLIIEVPDISQKDCPLNEYKHYKPNEHLTYWTPIALNSLRERYLPQFKQIHITAPIPSKLQVVWSKSRVK